MAVLITVDDLRVFAPDLDGVKAQAMIDDAVAQAAMVAPCLADASVTLSDQQAAAVKATLRRAILRWNEVGVTSNRTQTTLTAGNFSQADGYSVTASRGLFWPNEITDLQDVCKQAMNQVASQRAFNVDQVSQNYNAHQPWCNVSWGGTCSCGANLTAYRYPLWEGGLLS